jgi:nucleoside-diphosphate-sugar epimerase
VRLAGPPAHYLTREFPADRARIDIGSYHADDSAFRAAAGWQPRVSLEEGLERLLRWYRDHHLTVEQLLEQEVVHNWAPTA